MRKTILIILPFYLILNLLILSCSSLLAQENRVVFYHDDFEDGKADQWEIGNEWKMDTDRFGNHFLTAVGHQYASYSDRKMRGRYVFSCAVFIRKGGIRLHYLINKLGRYVITLQSNSILLSKEMADGSVLALRQVQSIIPNGIWNVVEIKNVRGQIEVRLNNNPQLRYLDNSPFFIGFPAIETLLNSDLSIDNITLAMEESTLSAMLMPNTWYATGGPSGGVGYDIRIHPQDHNIVFVTDVLSGINKSVDGGVTWKPKNTGILDRKGPTEDAIPIFSLTIDPNHPHIIWAGCQYSNGIYRSHDTGETWEKRNNGVEVSDRISFRGFAVHPQDSNTVIAAAQIQTTTMGRQFELSYGVFYKTTDGGLNWRRIEGDASINRVVIYHPTQPNIVYCSTGIFDTEALNSDKSKTPPDAGGVGVLKSLFSGDSSWERKNNKLTNLHIGFLEMNPKNPNVLYAAGYSDVWKDILPGHVYRTNNGGENWRQLSAGGREGDSFTVITVAPSDTNCLYAASHSAFYRSLDGGQNWQKLWRSEEETWGPEGLLIGFPISIAVHPTDKMKVYINNYGGGAFISEDGGVTWKNSSDGYSGADIRSVNIDPLDNNRIFVAGRSGPFRSADRGRRWTGIAKHDGIQANYTMTLFPNSSTSLLASGDDHFTIVKSEDSGTTWNRIFPTDDLKLPQITTDFISTIAVSWSNPQVIYAGARKTPGIGSFDPSPLASVGIFKSSDRGASWFRFNDGLDDTQTIINTIAIHPINSDIAWASVYQHGIFKTQWTNTKLTWVNKNNGLRSTDIRCIAVNPRNPDILYAGSGDGGGLFKSTDGGNSWSSINNGIRIHCPTLSPIGMTTFGLDFNKSVTSYHAMYYPIDWTKILDIVLDPVDPEKIYICDLSSGVYVTTDGGAHWALMNDGLINRAVACLGISADGKMLYAGTYGSGVYYMQIAATLEGS